MIQIGPVTLYHGNCAQILAALPADSVDSIVCDPPYGLSFMGKAWDYQVPSVAEWQAALRVLKPGGHLLSFAGSRTYHRMAVNIEDAGFEIRDQIMWVYGSGFPKSLDISKAIDKAAGVEFGSTPAAGVGFMNAEGAGGYNVTKNQLFRVGESTDAARQWQGWGTALKPAHEPIVVARKPLGAGTVAANVLRYGTGGLNIDGCRVVTAESTRRVNHAEMGYHGGNTASVYETGSCDGRFPANLIHDGSDDVAALFPDTKSGALSPDMNIKASSGWSGGSQADRVKNTFEANGGSAARFFYCAKASKSDRGEHNDHPTVKPQALMRYLCRMVTPAGGVVLDHYAGSGSTGVAAITEGFNSVLIEQDEHSFNIACGRSFEAWARGLSK